MVNGEPTMTFILEKRTGHNKFFTYIFTTANLFNSIIILCMVAQQGYYVGILYFKNHWTI